MHFVTSTANIIIIVIVIVIIFFLPTGTLFPGA